MRDEINNLVRTINNSWLANTADEIPKILANCFHEDMIIKGRNLDTLARGKEASIRSYVDFIKQAKISAFSPNEPDIQVIGDTAIATYGWNITYTLDGQEYRESGHDVFVFSRTNGKWLAIWRAMLTEPQE